MVGEDMATGDEKEEVGGAIHPPIFGTKHMDMLVFRHSCFLAIWFSIFDRFSY